MSILPTGHTVTHGATQGIVRWLLASRVPNAIQDAHLGAYLLPFPWQYKLAVSIGTLLTISFLVLGAVALPVEPVPMIVFFGVFAPLCGAFLWAVYDALGHTIGFSDAGLTRQSPWGRSAHLPWSLVTSAEYSSLANHFVFRAPGHPAIRVSVFRSGLGTFNTVAARALKYSPVGRVPYLLSEKAKNPS